MEEPEETICRICFGSSIRGATPVLLDESRWVEKTPRRVTEKSLLGLLMHQVQNKFISWQASNAEEFIVPCACSGTMKHVHRGCLDVWRKGSPRRDSFNRCEQCHQEYTFHTPLLGHLLAHPAFLLLSSMAVYGLILASFFVLAHAALRLVDHQGSGYSGYEFVEIRARPWEDHGYRFDYLELYPPTGTVTLTEATRSSPITTTTTVYTFEELSRPTSTSPSWENSPQMPALVGALYMACIFDFIILNISWIGVFLLMLGLIRMQYFHACLFDQIMLIGLATVALIRIWQAVRDQISLSLCRVVRIHLSRIVSNP